jgi:hypothetical protein
MAQKDYSKGKIYKIEPLDGEEGDIYIGSTCRERLSQRMTAHRSSYCNWKNGKLNFTTSYNLFDKYGIENCKIILLELVNATTLDEILSREAFYIKSLKCINKVIPLRTTKQYHADNKEHYDEIKREWRKNNVDKVKESKIKSYQLNKNSIKEKQKKYYEMNKEIINQKQKEKVLCECGCMITFGDRIKHYNTKKHKNNI